MILRHLEFLTALARERHFARAATACKVTQSTLSAGIKQMEESLGVLLVERGQRYVGLTPEGVKVLEWAQHVITDFEGLQQNLTEMRRGLGGQLKIGAIPVTLPIISLLTTPFAKRHPHTTTVIRSLSSNNNTTPIYNSTNQLRGTFSGSLFALPAGEVKLALGGELYVQHITKDQVGSANTGPTSSGATIFHYRYHRVVQSGFAEFQIPVISPEMNIPLVQKLSFDVSGRLDSFSDVGSTANPKYAMDWQVDSDLKFRANYSQSFVAPPLLSLGDPAYGYTYQGGASTGGQIDNIPIANFAGIQYIPGAICTTTGKTIATSPGCLYATLGSTPGANGVGGNQGL